MRLLRRRDAQGSIGPGCSLGSARLENAVLAVRLCDRCALAPKEDEKLTTVVDVARRAGVLIATVSRVLRGTPNVTETTRRKVMEAVAELGYLPNRMAQGLRLGRTNTVAFAVGDIEQTI